MTTKKCAKKKRKCNKTLKNLKKKIKGFTLVELLAVIVILAIIMIIAIPSVLDTLATAKRKTFDEYLTKVYTATEKEYLSKQMLEGTKSCVMYDIGKDIGLSSTGNYKGYTLVVKTDGGNVNDVTYNYYITMWDDEYMVYGLRYGDEYTYEAFISEDDEKLSKANLAAVAGCSKFEDHTTGGTGEALPGGGNSNGTPTTPKTPPFKLTDNDEDGQPSINDMACIGEECFYIYKVDGDKVRMLSRYNLDVGYMAGPNHTPVSNPTGIQSEKTLKDGGPYYNTYYGTYGYVAISNNYSPRASSGGLLCYWTEIGSDGFSYIKDGYGGANSYNNDTYVYDSNSPMYSYISNYKNYLTGKGAGILEARVISYDEIIALGCNESRYGKNYCTNAPKWVSNTAFWTGNRSGGSNAGAIFVDYDYGSKVAVVTKYGDCNSTSNGGVRPVIIVNKNQIG